MALNTNGIKISIKEEADTEEKQKKALPKKAPPKKRAVPPKAVKQNLKPNKISGQEKKVAPKTEKRTKKKGKGLIKFLLSMIVPAIIVGGGIYFWQQDITEKTITTVRQEAQKNESSFEERLRNLKNKLTGVEDENQKLKKESEVMNRRIALLDKAKIDFSDETLGINFTYPAVFGEVIITNTDIASGTKFIGTFSDNEKLIFGGISSTLELNKEESGVFAVTDNQGYLKDKDDYYYLASGENKYEIKPAEVLSTKSNEALLIDKNSFVINPEEDGLAVDIGGNVAVLVNLDNEEYRGFAFMNSDFGMMPLESFKQMISTIKN